ncbi:MULTISPECIES: LysR substrate-binding domain-containing protein [Thalassospira]|uniref:LysR family transcriptional regulator n=2 Tax=Thalassospira tepidiphila TaxID=393657 RepID=A0A853KVC3_9PROT|nr:MULTISPECIES: LysR substrate-binding domain-containing protein [Thalassospira]MBE70214.1 LysR family transcriptional regulator [Thalassospira sp.]KZC99669.1 LysR family transcriptional regulator [Thalassospira sp. MCCC 1A02898]MBP3127595.1 LysR family transcriptional regulator [Thalassospira sp. ER-Se-21-Dark]NJB76727.1 DNA-binding transcriptional LysR family regulator [Thalassospira tepidiphila]OAZ07862.1 LysR family transcriptional regulator [Thalassospira tepidiphila MCCC 1A03514]
MNSPTSVVHNLDLDLARTFVAICETGNFSRAAEKVHRSASAISLQVKKLETMVGRELFKRETRKVTMTEDGEVLLGYARRLLKLNDEAMSHFHAPEFAGTVRLGVPNDTGIVAIPEILKRFAQTHPHVDIDVNLGPTRTLRQAIHKGDLDIAVFSFDAELDRQPPIHAEPLVWLGARHGSAIDKRPLPVSMAEPGCYWRTMALKALDDAGVNYRIAYTSEFCQAQIAAVRADLAIAPLPISVISDDLVHLGPSHGLPEIGEYRMTLAKRDGHGAVEEALAEHVIAGFRKISERGMRVFA